VTADVTGGVTGGVTGRWCVPRAGPPELARDLVCTWTATPTGEHRLIPDGCVDIVWLDDGRAWLCGTERAAWTFRLPPGVAAAGVRFRPGVATAVFGVDGRAIANRRVPLDAVITPAAARRLDERLTEGGDRHAVLVDEARRWLSRAPRPVDPIAAAAATSSASMRPHPVDHLADALGVSPRQVHRRCVQTFGYGASTLTRILRLQRFLGLAARGTPSLAHLAATAGYADQAHLGRDCRELAGLSPRTLLVEMSDPYQTTIGPPTTMDP
jgi:AraC-like DNA-binding protein